MSKLLKPGSPEERVFTESLQQPELPEPVPPEHTLLALVFIATQLYLFLLARGLIRKPATSQERKNSLGQKTK